MRYAGQQKKPTPSDRPWRQPTKVVLEGRHSFWHKSLFSLATSACNVQIHSWLIISSPVHLNSRLDRFKTKCFSFSFSFAVFHFACIETSLVTANCRSDHETHPASGAAKNTSAPSTGFRNSSRTMLTPSSRRPVVFKTPTLDSSQFTSEESMAKLSGYHHNTTRKHCQVVSSDARLWL